MDTFEWEDLTSMGFASFTVLLVGNMTAKEEIVSKGIRLNASRAQLAVSEVVRQVNFLLFLAIFSFCNLLFLLPVSPLQTLYYLITWPFPHRSTHL